MYRQRRERPAGWLVMVIIALAVIAFDAFTLWGAQLLGLRM